MRLVLFYTGLTIVAVGGIVVAHITQVMYREARIARRNARNAPPPPDDTFAVAAATGGIDLYSAALEDFLEQAIRAELRDLEEASTVADVLARRDK